MDNSNDELEQFGPYIKKPEGKTKKIIAGTFGAIGGTIFTLIIYAFVD